MIGTFGEDLLVDAFFAGTFHQIADIEIVFIFENFFCHSIKLVRFLSNVENSDHLI